MKNDNENTSSVVYYTNPLDSNIVYKRTGYCCRCGQCCGLETIPCEFLSMSLENGIPVASCLVRNEVPSQYASGCNIWPSMPEHIESYPKCTYKFEIV